jgi:putative dimethyl sulfoxide reductase chaperone
VTPPSQVEHLQARASTYRLLARLTLQEVDAVLADLLKGMPIFGPALDDSGGGEALQELRAEYARLFLLGVPPYESVYLDESGLLNTAQSAAVLEHYRQHGFEPPALRSVGAPDHLGLQLDLMAHLLDLQSVHLQTGEPVREAALQHDLRHLLDEHLTRWAPIVGRLLVESSVSAFYRALGESIEVFVLGEQALLAGSPEG